MKEGEGRYIAVKGDAIEIDQYNRMQNTAGEKTRVVA
jgi:hypothetical protein